MTQYSTKKLLQKFVDRGTAAIDKELRYLPTIEKIKPDDPKDITKEDQCALLGYLMFFREKFNVSIKVRG